MIGKKFQKSLLLSSVKVVASWKPWKPFERKLIGRRFENRPEDSSSLEPDDIRTKSHLIQNSLASNWIVVETKDDKCLGISLFVIICGFSLIQQFPALRPTFGHPEKTILSLFEQIQITFPSDWRRLFREQLPHTRNLVKIAETLIPRQIFHDSAENNAWQRFESHLSRKAGEPRRCLLHFLKSTSCCVYLEGKSICTLVQLK